MFRLLVVFAILSCAYGFSLSKLEESENNNETEKIVGGQLTTIQKRPYQVSIITSDGQRSSMCGGSIIGKRWVLTAAHCMKDAKTITVRAGSSYLRSGGTVFVTKIFRVHPSYNKTVRLDYDVALVQIPRDIVPNGSTIKIVSLAAAGTNVPKGTMATVSGWGKTAPDGQTSNQLREVTVPVIDKETCKSIWNKFTPRMMCAGYKGGGRDKCQGDSGGPLVLANGRQIGIVSFGVKCGTEKYPGVYCDVASVRNWIKQVSGI